MLSNPWRDGYRWILSWPRWILAKREIDFTVGELTRSWLSHGVRYGVVVGRLGMTQLWERMSCDCATVFICCLYSLQRFWVYFNTLIHNIEYIISFIPLRDTTWFIIFQVSVCFGFERSNATLHIIFQLLGEPLVCLTLDSFFLTSFEYICIFSISRNLEDSRRGKRLFSLWLASRLQMNGSWYKNLVIVTVAKSITRLLIIESGQITIIHNDDFHVQT